MKILFPYMARWKAINWTRYHSLLTSLALRGHHVIVLQPPRMDSKETNFQDINVEIPNNISLVDVEINPIIWNTKYPLNKIFKKGYYSLVCLNKVREIIRKENIDVILLYNIPQYFFMQIKGPIKVFDYGDDYLDMLSHELGFLANNFTMRLGKIILNSMVNNSDVVFSISKVLSKNIGRNAIILPNGVDLNNIGKKMATENHWEKKSCVIGFVGSFEYFIDFDLILKVAEMVPEYSFLMVGGGREWNRIKGEIKVRNLKNIILTGGVTHEHVFDYINTMDICLNIFKQIPVSHAACPLKLFEYLSMKKPVISTRLDEVKYIDNGFIYYGDSPEEVVEQIRKITRDDYSRNMNVEKGYQTVLNNYTWDRIAEKFIKIVEQNINKHSDSSHNRMMVSS